MPTASERIRRLASRARTLAIVYTLALIVATHYPSVPRFALTVSDKIEHYFAYGILTFFVLLCWELTTGVLHAKHYFAVWLAGTLYAAIDEITQIPVGRSCDINDWAADTFGIACSVLLFCWLRKPLYRLLLGKDAKALGAS